jgi:uncharacterized membrane protein
MIVYHIHLSQVTIDKLLRENIYHGRQAWQQFLRLLFIALGVGFTVAGIVFFFAYNWADLHKFVKIGLTAGLIVATTILSLLPRFNGMIRNSILTGSAILVGVLFAVFGQIYQTGANAYDFFLAWTVFITLWVLVAGFAPLWLIYLVLINTTVTLYSEQVAQDWRDVDLYTILFFLNSLALLISHSLSHLKKIKAVPSWFRNTVALAAVAFATFGIIIVIYSNYNSHNYLLVLGTLALYTLGIRHGITTKSIFYLSIIPFSVIVMITAQLLDVSTTEGMLFFVSLFIITSVTILIKTLIELQKKWNHAE